MESLLLYYHDLLLFHQCFDTVSWVAGKAFGLQKGPTPDAAKLWKTFWGRWPNLE